jgi:predicted small metal-binding protein
MGFNYPFVIKGNTRAEVTKKALEHAREMHANDFNVVNSPAEIE